MFISYTNAEEAIICTSETEPETIKQFFTEGGRDIDDYDLETSDDVAVRVSADLRVR